MSPLARALIVAIALVVFDAALRLATALDMPSGGTAFPTKYRCGT